MEYVLAGFRQFDNVRRYYFDARGENLKRGAQVIVSADLNLIRRYNIPLQELPLLCRHLLEEHEQVEAITLTERDMVRYDTERTAAKAAMLEKRKSHFPKGGG
jgi:hypothetical protein